MKKIGKIQILATFQEKLVSKFNLSLFSRRHFILRKAMFDPFSLPRKAPLDPLP